ncbi:MAG TPA: superoxide dismutase [Cu-Zn] SodC [Cellvibrionaceae bacterium]
MLTQKQTTAVLTGLFFSGAALAGSLTVDIHKVGKEGAQEKLGTVTAHQTEYGVVFQPDLKGLEPGAHGFHLHQHPSCEPGDDGTPAGAAGGHFDPRGTNNHGAPWGDGHMGDLPALHVDSNGSSTYAVLAPRITLDLLKNRALMIHSGGDNYADEPKPLGGGGKRVACGTIQ